MNKKIIILFVVSAITLTALTTILIIKFNVDSIAPNINFEKGKIIELEYGEEEPNWLQIMHKFDLGNGKGYDDFGNDYKNTLALKMKFALVSPVLSKDTTIEGKSYYHVTSSGEKEI